ncbi:MAG: flagellar motor switch protein FliG [Treponema sp.]|jgi:flagellar motor switch protein FliG|nr:flagellar motor switch protein FliG [Treponema sp.]
MARTILPGGGDGNFRRGIEAYKQTLRQPQAADASGIKGGPTAPPQAASGFAAAGSKDDPVSGLFKTGALGGSLAKGFERIGKKPAGAEGESRYRRVAKFLILIGGDEASRILSGLDAEQVEEIAKEIASIRGITSGEAETVFEEFRGFLRSSGGAEYTGGTVGGLEEARRLLYAAFGPVQGETFLRRTIPEAAGNPLDFLDDFSGEQVAFLLREEVPAAAALVLSRLTPKMSAAVLANTPPDRKLEIVRRIAHLGQVSPEVLERVAGVLREKARHIAEANAAGEPVEVDGMNALTAILKHADNSFGERLLSELEEDDPDIGRILKDRLYTLEDVIEAGNRPIQEKLKAMENRDIALLLKGRSPGFTDKILSNVSANRRTLIREEAEFLGPVPKIEVEAAARDFLAWFRLGREEGKILLRTDEDVIV